MQRNPLIASGRVVRAHRYVAPPDAPNKMSQSRRAEMAVATRESPPTGGGVDVLIITNRDFWDKPVAHVTLADGAVNVVLEDAIDKFCGIDQESNRSRDKKSAIASVLSGAHTFWWIPRNLSK